MEKINKIISKNKRKVIGLMSGTSADGVDSALVEIEGFGLKTRFNLIKFNTYPIPDNIREQLFRIFPPSKCTVEDICELNFLIGDIFANSALEIIKEAGLKPFDIDLIGSHGQTVCHLPSSNIPSTLQIGEPAIISNKTGIITVADFRVADVAVGGQGAPLVPYVDFLLLGNEYKTRAVQNIGGISNVTVLPANGKIDDVIAFDTGPGNMMIDETVRIITKGQMKYDFNGEIASNGSPNKDLLDKLLLHPFIRKNPPKTTGREEFGTHWTQKIVQEARSSGISDVDIVATVTEFTARSIYENYRRFILPKYDISEVLICGGGVHNQAIIRSLKEMLSPIKIGIVDDYGLPSDAKEAIAFAILANETIHGNAGNIPNVTGAKKSVVLGKIVV
ncbi:MAG: anhydro-N-acetylmuramic acid kinase [Candidatus Poribacteria bacterium]